jgi:hypothetical protein
VYTLSPRLEVITKRKLLARESSHGTFPCSVQIWFFFFFFFVVISMSREIPAATVAGGQGMGALSTMTAMRME